MNTQNQPDDVVVNSLAGTTDFSSRGVKYLSGARLPIFGHAGHSLFRTNSTSFIDVPGTYGTTYFLGQGRYRLEVAFATDHDGEISLRMFDPANPTQPAEWEFNFIGGHAPDSWWSFQTTEAFSLTRGRDPWPRQSTLQARSIDGSSFNLGSVTLVVEDFAPQKLAEQSS
tara:strand:- start:35 stop:544 length:510 start_codon:yes stop_codon:yes gene_type:complete